MAGSTYLGTLTINQNGHRDGVKKSLNPEKMHFIYLLFIILYIGAFCLGI